MRFKVGDKVKFLNETGGGVITAIMDSKLVKVQTDDGFEMPVLSKDLIPDYREKETEEIRQFYETPKEKAGTPPVRQEEQAEEQPVTPLSPWSDPKEEEGFYLLFEPHEQQWVLTGSLDVLLVNHTPFEILYNLFLKRDGKTEGVDYGSVPSESKIVLATITRDELEHWTQGYIQLLIHESHPEKVFLPVHTVLDIRAQRFYKEGSYKTSTLTNSKAVTTVIALRSALALASTKAGKTDAVPVQTRSTPQKEIPFIEKYRTAPGEAVVDLHIGEIVDNISGLDSRDMIHLQLNHFQKALESAITEGYTKVTFIHGIGNGTLKNAIIKEIQTYENMEHSMASIIKFGVGALDVSIKPR